CLLIERFGGRLRFSKVSLPPLRIVPLALPRDFMITCSVNTGSVFNTRWTSPATRCNSRATNAVESGTTLSEMDLRLNGRSCRGTFAGEEILFDLGELMGLPTGTSMAERITGLLTDRTISTGS